MSEFENSNSEKDFFEEKENNNENGKKDLEQTQKNIDPTAIADETGSVFVGAPEAPEISNSDFTDKKTTEEINNFDDLIKPQIELNKNPEKYIKREKSGGFRVFTIIISVVLIVALVFTCGYFVGNFNQKSVSTKNNSLSTKASAKVYTADQVYSKINPSVVGIVVYTAKGVVSNASGVIYSSDGYIVTNDHIYSEAEDPKFKVVLYNGKEVNAKYIAGDSRSDLSVLKISASDLTAADFGNSDECINGEDVVAIGRPSGATSNSNITKGIISANSIRVSLKSGSYSEKFIQTDTAINPGSSGGALCNIYGQVIGVTSSKLVGENYENVGYAIPSVKVKKIVNSLIKNGYVNSRGVLGVTYTEIDTVTAEVNKVKPGLLIYSVKESSSLYNKADKNDIITHVNGKAITSSEVILDIIEEHKPGDTLILTVYSPETKKTTKISAVLKEDKGSSSYKTKDNSNNNSSKNDNSKENNRSQYNASEFDFPEVR